MIFYYHCSKISLLDFGHYIGRANLVAVLAGLLGSRLYTVYAMPSCWIGLGACPITVHQSVISLSNAISLNTFLLGSIGDLDMLLTARGSWLDFQLDLVTPSILPPDGKYGLFMVLQQQQHVSLCCVVRMLVLCGIRPRMWWFCLGLILISWMPSMPALYFTKKLY